MRTPTVLSNDEAASTQLQFAEELNLARRAHAGAALRAASVWHLLTQLKDCTIRVPRIEAVCFIANQIYSNVSYDACERYETLEEFEAELAPDVDAVYAGRATEGDVELLVLRPFFGEETDFLQQLGLSYLHGCSPKDLQALNVEAFVAPLTTVIGVSKEEHDALVAFHRSAALRLVNRLRHLRTALHYVSSGLKSLNDPKRKRVECELDARAHGLVEALTAGCDLPFEPAPCWHFGTEADRVNPLRSLPRDAEALAPLLG